MRTLSSLNSIPLKILIPVIWIILVLIALGRILFFTKSADPDEKWVFLFFSVFFTAQVWEALRLKVIRIDDHNLYILNYTKEISVPLSEILNVTQNRWLKGGNLVTIQLQSPSEFGCKIRFLPKTRFFFLLVNIGRA